MPAGRPTDLTPEVIAEVKRLLPVALYLETVADYLAVDRTTFRNWLRRGAREAKRRARGRARERPAEALFLEFFHAVKRALAEGELHAAGAVRRATQAGVNPISRKTTTRTTQAGDTTTTVEERYANPEWTAAACLLERRWPEHWGRDRDLLRELVKEVGEIKEQQHHAQPAATARQPAPDPGVPAGAERNGHAVPP